MKPTDCYNNIIFSTNHLEKKCNFHESISNFDQTDLCHRIRFELLPHLDQIKLSITGEHPCCMAGNLLLVVTDLRDTISPNAEIQKRFTCVENA